MSCANSVLHAISTWIDSNQMCLNVDKSCYMMFNYSNISRLNFDFKLSYKGQSLNRVTSTKFLGVILDDALSFHLHISSLTAELCFISSIFYFARSFLILPALKHLYNSLVSPLLNVAADIYLAAYNSFVNKLIKV